MPRTEFPIRARRDDPKGWMVVQQMLEFLRDAFDASVAVFARGTATITAGNVGVIVTHGLTVAAYSVVATPLVDPTLRWWISGKTSTQFQLNLSGAAPVGGVSFDWIVKGG